MALTKPQVALLMRSMRFGEIGPSGPEWRTADALCDKGLLDRNRIGWRQINGLGLVALRDYCQAEYKRSGSVASMVRLEEVERYLAGEAA